MSNHIIREMLATEEGRRLYRNSPIYNATYNGMSFLIDPTHAGDLLVHAFAVACKAIEDLQKEKLNAWRRDPVVFYVKELPKCET